MGAVSHPTCAKLQRDTRTTAAPLHGSFLSSCAQALGLHALSCDFPTPYIVFGDRTLTQVLITINNVNKTIFIS